MTKVIIARDTRKSFGEVEAVRGVSFDVHPSECYGLLGPNGAGKTTTMDLIRCVSPLDSGQLKVLGRDVKAQGRQIRARIGVVPQHDSLDPDLTVLDNLRQYASYFGVRSSDARERSMELLRFMALEEKAGTRIDKLSGGMRRRLLIARGLINRPRLLILDEPTSGLDPQARLHIWQRLRLLKTEGTTMVLCTHYMDEAERLCDRLAIIDQGRILAEGSPGELIARHAGKELIAISGAGAAGETDLEEFLERSLPSEVRLERHEDTLYCYAPKDTSFPPAFVETARKKGYGVTARQPNLEDVFLNLTGRELRQ